MTDRTEQLKTEREQIQRKTFTKWVNSHLVKVHGSADAVTDLTTDFKTGTKLMKLVNALYGKTIPKHNLNPKIRPQLMDNITLALKMVDDAGIKTNFLKSVHLADGDLKMILGMVWCIILDYQIKGISVEELSAKEGLLLWCQRRTKGYRDVSIDNFTNSWKDGLGFCAIIHSYRPDLIPWDTLDKANKKDNLNLAFTVAEKELGITQLLDVDDMEDPDERSVITYLSEYFHCFSKVNQGEVAGRRIAKIVGIQRQLDDLKNDYVARAQKFVDWMNVNKQELASRDFGNTLAEVQAQWDSWTSEYKKQTRPAKMTEKLELETVFNTLQTKLRVNNRKPFVPPTGLHPKDIQAMWDEMTGAEAEKDEALRAELQRMFRIENLVSKFNTKQRTLQAWGDATSAVLGNQDAGNSLSEVQAKLTINKNALSDIEANKERLADIKTVSQALEAERYSNQDDINSKSQALDSMFDNLTALAQQQEQLLQQALAHEQQLEDWRVAFATKAREFLQFTEDCADALADPTRANDLAEIHALQQSFANINARIGEKENEFAQIAELAGHLEGLQNVYTFTTFAEIEAKWNDIKNQFAQRAQDLQQEQQRQEEDEQHRVAFAQACEEFLRWVNSEKASVEAISGADIASQIAASIEKRQALNVGDAKVQELAAQSDTMAQRHITYNPHSKESLESCAAAYKALTDMADKAISTLQQQQIAQQSSGVPAEQLQEFKEMFAVFDKDKDQLLAKHEFKACLASLGHDASDADVDKLLAEIAHKEPGKVVFDEFVDYMVKKTEDSDSAASIATAFKTLGGKDQYVSEQEIKRFTDPTTASYLLANMNQADNGMYDYQQFVSAIYQ